MQKAPLYLAVASMLTVNDTITVCDKPKRGASVCRGACYPRTWLGLFLQGSIVLAGPAEGEYWRGPMSLLYGA